MAEELARIRVSAEDATKGAFDRLQNGIASVTRSYQALQGVLAGAGVFSAMQKIVQATVEAERANNRLSAALRATGQSAGITKAELNEMAETLKSNSAFDDDEIRKGISSLLRFRDVQGDVFRDAARLAVDLAAALDTDLNSAFTRLGRALEDPEKGLRALRDAGLNVTSTQERVKKVMEETGDVAQAQKIILEDLQKSIGGAAAGENTGLYGSIKAAGKAWDDFLKGLGQLEGENKRLQRIFGFIRQGLDLITPGGARGGGPSQLERDEAERGRREAESLRLQENVQRQVDDQIKKIEEEAAKREERLREEDVKGWIAHADEVFREEEEHLRAMEKLHDEYWAREEKLRQEDIKGWIAHADAVFDEAEQEALALARIAEEQAEKTRKAAEQLGFTFASAFEDAIVEGEKLRDVLKGMLQDILRIFIRMTVTQPLAGALASAFSGGLPFLGAADTAGFQHGGQFMVGGSGGADSQRVGFWATPGERVTVETPEQQRRGGVTINQVVNFSAGTSSAVRDAVFQMLPQIAEASKNAVFDAQLRGNRV